MVVVQAFDLGVLFFLSEITSFTFVLYSGFPFTVLSFFD